MLGKVLKNNQLFLIPYVLLLVFSTVILLSYEKGEIHLFVNRYHNAFFDYFFALITNLGDGWFVTIPILILLFFSLRHAVFILTTYLSSGLITQIIKRVFFNDVIRPSRLLEDSGLHYVEGVDLLRGLSFPSGHATSAFAIFVCIALIVNNRFLKIVCLIVACLVAFSRVYLSQHFLIDIVVGSIIGSTGALIFYMIFYKDNRKWHSWSITNAFKHEQIS